MNWSNKALKNLSSENLCLSTFCLSSSAVLFTRNLKTQNHWIKPFRRRCCGTRWTAHEKKKTSNGIDDFLKKIIAGQYSCIFSKFSSFKALMSKKTLGQNPISLNSELYLLVYNKDQPNTDNLQESVVKHWECVELHCK